MSSGYDQRQPASDLAELSIYQLQLDARRSNRHWLDEVPTARETSMAEDRGAATSSPTQ